MNVKKEMRDPLHKVNLENWEINCSVLSQNKPPSRFSLFGPCPEFDQICHHQIHHREHLQNRISRGNMIPLSGP